MANESTNQTCQLWDAKTFGQRLSLSKRQIFRVNSCAKIPYPPRPDQDRRKYKVVG